MGSESTAKKLKSNLVDITVEAREKLVQAKVLPSQGEGPDEKKRNESSFKLLFVAEKGDQRAE